MSLDSFCISTCGQCVSVAEHEIAIPVSVFRYSPTTAVHNQNQGSTQAHSHLLVGLSGRPVCAANKLGLPCANRLPSSITSLLFLEFLLCSTQDEPAYCGLSSVAMTLNALSIDPKRPWKGVWRWFHEELLDCCKPLVEIQKDGVTLSQVWEKEGRRGGCMLNLEEFACKCVLKKFTRWSTVAMPMFLEDRTSAEATMLDGAPAWHTWICCDQMVEISRFYRCSTG